MELISDPLKEFPSSCESSIGNQGLIGHSKATSRSLRLMDRISKKVGNMYYIDSVRDFPATFSKSEIGEAMNQRWD